MSEQHEKRLENVKKSRRPNTSVKRFGEFQEDTIFLKLHSNLAKHNFI